ncbi:MAG: glycosyltransferase [Patescibacteria group bacterium]
MKKVGKYSVSIVLPNWNGEVLLAKNLPAVIAASKGAQIIVADDASTDESIAMIKMNFPQITIVSNKKQQGFSSNINSGVKKATGEIVVLLNTDVRPKEDFLDALLPHFDDETVFAVGCLEQSHEKNGMVERGRGLSRWEKGYFIHSKGAIISGATAWVSGGSGAYRKSIWNELGGMDPLFNPFYWEDIDLSYTARKAGYQTLFEPKSIVGHFHHQGKIKTSFSPNAVKQIVYRNQFEFIWKNASDSRVLLAHAVWTPIRLLQAVLRGDFMMVLGFIRAFVRLPAIYACRYRVATLWKRTDGELSVRV